MPCIENELRVDFLDGFDDPVIAAGGWNELLTRGDTDAVNLTWEWQRCWWETFGRGRLLLAGVFRGDQLIAVAPFFADEGMVFNICPEDHLDVVGDMTEPAMLEALLSATREHVEPFLGFRLYFIPDCSGRGVQLQQVAGRLGLDCYREAQLASPWIDVVGNRDLAERCATRKSLLRHERYFQREGELNVETDVCAANVLPQLDHFFEQHIERRSVTPHASLFLEQRQRDYYRRLTEVAAAKGWLRFTRVSWKGREIAYHFGLSYKGRYLWGIPSFDVSLARHSPGEVLLRHVILDALREGARQFDFGPGDEPYKYRFATNTTYLETWGLYPRPTR